MWCVACNAIIVGGDTQARDSFEILFITDPRRVFARVTIDSDGLHSIDHRQAVCKPVAVLNHKQPAIHWRDLGQGQPACEQRLSPLKPRAKEHVVVMQVRLLALAWSHATDITDPQNIQSS